jgi:cyclophilin family peptidyl-prolyl cis-trans isomerase
MRRTAAALRGAKGRGWYTLYKEKPEDFARLTKPTAFDWTAEDAFCQPSVRPRAFFTLASGGETLGTLEFELAKDIVPRTVENFSRLVTGANHLQRSYKQTKILRIQKGMALLAGDVLNNDGSASVSVLNPKESTFADENFIIPHSGRGLLSMASVGVKSNGSQFYVSLGECPHLNGRSVVFGRLVSGEDVLAKTEKVFSVRRVPVTDIVISDCGLR